MYNVTTIPSAADPRQRRLRTTGRWMLTFVGFPLGGYAAFLLLGPVDNPWIALLGGLLTGAAIGVSQACGISRNRPPIGTWTAATAIGMMIGLAVGAATVDYATSLTALIIQGSICGFAVGAAQALVLRPLLGRLAFAWPPALAVIWAIGWWVTTAAGIDVEQQFTVFGAFGAIAVTALTAALPLILTRSRTSTS